jgi:hypothetical protein
VNALTRRLAEGWTDQYDSLQPVADLRNQLQVQLYLMVQRPVRWEGGEPGDDEKQVLIGTMSNAITKKLMELTRRRLAEDVRLERQELTLSAAGGRHSLSTSKMANGWSWWPPTEEALIRRPGY